MTTISIELEDDRAAALRDEARRSGLSPEEWLRQKIESLLTSPNSGREVPSFDEAAEYVLAKNQDLYERLA